MPRARTARASNHGTARRRGSLVRRIVACLIVLAALCVPPVFVNTAIGYLPALFALFLIVFSFAYGRACRRAFSYDALTSAASCVRGGSVDVLVRMRNASRLYVPRVDVEFSVRDLFGDVTSTDWASLALNPKTDQDFSLTIAFNHLGQFDIGLSRLVIHDPLGLFPTDIPAEAVCTVVVTPRLREVDDVPLSDAAVKQVSEALRPSSLPGSDYCGVRDYAQGDPLKLIHWKLSARVGTYLTKLFEEQSDPSLDVYLDLTTPAFDAETLMDVFDATLEMALSLEAYAHESGLDTRLIFLNAEDEPEQFVLTAGRNLQELMLRLPRIHPATPEPFTRLLVQRATSLRAADNIAVCSAHDPDTMADTLTQVRSTQRNVLLFSLVPTQHDEQVKACAQSLRALRNAGMYGYLVKAGGDVL